MRLASIPDDRPWDWNLWLNCLLVLCANVDDESLDSGKHARVDDN